MKSSQKKVVVRTTISPSRSWFYWSGFTDIPEGETKRAALSGDEVEKARLNMGGDWPVNTGASWFGGWGGRECNTAPCVRLKVH